MSDINDELTAGYHRFRADHWPAARAEYEALAQGQKPHTLIVACSDSRADPALIFDAAPGQLFVVRNVANLVPPYEPDGLLHGVSAALEFGVKVLNVKRIVVMGHAHCGGVNAMLNGAPDSCADFVAPWVAQGSAAGELTLTGLHFGIADGVLRALTNKPRFEPLA
jgi:carbonic anhydrase